MPLARIAIVQSAPVLFELQATIDKIENLTSQAADSGAQLVLFPEAFVSGYPRGLGFGSVVGDRSDEGRQLWLRYAQSALTIPGPDIERLGQIAKNHGVVLVVGVTERDTVGGTLYCTIVYLDSDGTLLGKHRKLKPTASERIIWGEGNATESLTVVHSKLGRIGGLICWENYMPLARMAIYQQGVDLYVAPTADQRPRWQSSMIHIAMEARCFVLSANQYVTKAMYPNDIAASAELAAADETLCRGGSMIVAPNGEILCGPVWDREEILVQDIELDEIQKAKMDFDVVGHYARGDLFEFRVK